MKRLLFAASAVLLFACGQSSSGTSASGSAVAQSSGSAKAGGPGKTATSLKYADEQAAYKAAFNDMSTMSDPIDKKVAVFVGKVGKPESTEGDKQLWHAVDGSTCHKIQLHKDGMAEDETVDKGECGL